jgi:dTDP-4-dehydrorhamnose 3,5-epimerase
MKLTHTEHPEVLVLEPGVFEDSRGCFFEAYNRKQFAAIGIESDFVQDNQSVSKRNVLRGLHYQIRQPQGKLIRVIGGEIFDVAVDCRKSSRSFSKSAHVTLSAENRKMIWIPAGFAHGFLVLSETAEVLYKTTDFYAPEFERTLLWNDPELGIPWPSNAVPVLSEKDQRGLPLAAAELFD